jgi:hypothetical protein
MHPILPRQLGSNALARLAGLAGLCVALLLLSNCATSAPGPTPTPTKTKVPTFTPAPPTSTATPVPPTATATLPPTATEAPTSTSTAMPTATTEPSPTPEPPTATPQPVAPRATARPVQPTAAPAPTNPPAVSDPCANIGGDGCKWRVTGGPATAENGGSELKLQFLFIHSGISGGQPQPFYFVVLEKDGVKLPVPDSKRSTPGTSQGPLGLNNYEFVLGLDKLPGNTVAGNYTLWVLDGNGERDSRNVTFGVPTNQGLLWIKFDQG